MERDEEKRWNRKVTIQNWLLPALILLTGIMAAFLPLIFGR